VNFDEKLSRTRKVHAKKLMKKFVLQIKNSFRASSVVRCAKSENAQIFSHNCFDFDRSFVYSKFAIVALLLLLSHQKFTFELENQIAIA
jgi:hypothetical protein